MGSNCKENSHEGTTSRLSYIHNRGTEPLKYLTIGDVLEQAARKYGDINAVVSLYDNQRITYKELLHQSRKLADGLLRLGLRKGDVIGLWAPNIAEWVVVFYAAARIGLITATINPKYMASELLHALNTCEVKVLICSDKYKSIDFYAILLSLIPELETSDVRNICSKTLPTLKTLITISTTNLKGTCNYYDLLKNAQNANGEDLYEVTPHDISNIQFSSGTTGKSKAVGLTHFQMVNNSYNIGKRLGMDDAQHIYCVQPPLFHVFGVVVCILSACQNGTTLVLPSPLYNSRENLKALEDERCTIVCGTPTMFIDLVNLQKQMNKKLCAYRALVGGASWPSKLIHNMENVLNIKQIKSVYGATEMTAAVFLTVLNAGNDELIERVGSIGEHIEAKVIDAQQRVVPFGTAGELYVRGYLTMTGYWKDFEITKTVLDETCWYKTGDQFILYEDGRGQVVGRLKDMIIRGGENISPTEVEDFLHSHPAIADAYVIGVANDRLGEEVAVCIKLKNGAELTLESLRSFCHEKIASYKIPTRLKVMEGFPKTSSGKVQKFMLRKEFETEIV